VKAFRQSFIRPYLELRSEIIQSVRMYFFDHDYMEVETPIRIPAPAPEAHIDAPPSGDWFLHSSPELCMKQLLAAGYSHIFQICKCFRQNERGQIHLPEFTMLEWYCANSDYQDMMTECEDMIRFLARRNDFGEELIYGEDRVDLRRPWDRISVSEAFDKFSPISMKYALAYGKFDEIIGCEIGPKLGRQKPVFLYDYPAECGALAKLKADDERFAERFELYICGIELCNAFSELTDPVIQRKRFENELNLRKAAGKTAYPMPEKFLKSMENMPQASGNALGIDRLIMLFANVTQIDDVVGFTPEDLC